MPPLAVHSSWQVPLISTLAVSQMLIQDYDHTLFLVEFCEPGIAPRLQGLAKVAYPGAPGQRIVTSLVLLSIVGDGRDQAAAA
jgi:hypothetical protein